MVTILDDEVINGPGLWPRHQVHATVACTHTRLQDARTATPVPALDLVPQRTWQGHAVAVSSGSCHRHDAIERAGGRLACLCASAVRMGGDDDTSDVGVTRRLGLRLVREIIFFCYIECVGGCREGFSNTNKKINYRTRQETARRI
jgi:hypothetical protein